MFRMSRTKGSTPNNEITKKKTQLFYVASNKQNKGLGPYITALRLGFNATLKEVDIEAQVWGCVSMCVPFEPIICIILVFWFFQNLIYVYRTSPRGACARVD